jgi:hypothetical protein
MTIYDTREGVRLVLNRQKKGHWNRWGPFLSERAWGTVREDYSASGDAWSYFPHDHARSRVYRWNEDGLGGICDRHQYLCFALALWNGKDPFLKERMFGLTGSEGNHGEDLKEYYYYLDNTPTHSYMKALYKYPQAEYPYQQLIEENQRRGKEEMEHELVDTGIFDDGRYFDVLVEYAKIQAEDLLIRITISNRGPEAAPIHLLPTLWFRNTWSWGRDDRHPQLARGATEQAGDLSPDKNHPVNAIIANHWELGEYILYCSDADELLFTENETNTERLYGVPLPTPYVKDAFHAYVVEGQKGAINPAETGTKAAAYYSRTINPGETLTFKLRLAAAVDEHPLDAPLADFDVLIEERQEEADEFYDVVLPPNLSADARLVARQAFAGLLWSKQFYHYVINYWLNGDPAQPPPPESRRQERNHDWKHLFNADVISMPDKWEFPWYASWDLGFHCITLAHVDPQFAKEQIILMLREWYMHPNGQIPAYEWNFEDVNPPILPIAALRVFEIERDSTGTADYTFLERVFQKMMLNFTWWVNRKDALGNDVFQGGFLGMDNIGAFDRDNLPEGYLLGQADGTSWMAAFAKSMTTIALILAQKDPVFEDVSSKFGEHFFFIGNAMNSQLDPGASLWDEEDGFFYDYLLSPDGGREPVRGRTMVGFVPLFGANALPAKVLDRQKFPELMSRRDWFMKHFPHMMKSVGPMTVPGANDTLIMELVRPDQFRRMLGYMLDENEFLSPYGIRAVSRYHQENPLVIDVADQEFRLDYEPGESTTNLFGGNSNWRGPIWMPVNYLILNALDHYYTYYGDSFQVECPTNSGQLRNLQQITAELAGRLGHIFLRDKNGRRAVFGEYEIFQNDPHWRDLILFHEYFHGDTGRGCGASHQTGWTGLIAHIIIEFPDQFSKDG